MKPQVSWGPQFSNGLQRRNVSTRMTQEFVFSLLFQIRIHVFILNPFVLTEPHVLGNRDDPAHTSFYNL